MEGCGELSQQARFVRALAQISSGHQIIAHFLRLELTIAIAVALFSTAVGVVAFGLSFWMALLLYSVSGTAATLFVAWRRIRCMEHHRMQPEQS